MSKKLISWLLLTLILMPLGNALSLDNNVVALWLFDENTNETIIDSSNNGNNGIIYGGAIRTNDSISHLALELDGVDDKVAIVKTSSVDITEKLTIEVSIKRQSNNNGTIISKNGPYFLAIKNNVVVGGVYTNDGKCPSSCNTFNTWIEIHGSTIIEQDKWYNIKMTYDGTEIKIYLNGILQNSAPKTGQMPMMSQNINIGWGDPGQDQFFKGVIDEIRISNITRKENLLSKDLEGENPENIIGYYMMNENAAINWTSPLDLSSYWFDFVSISYNYVEINSLATNNKNARVTLNNLPWNNPRILKDGNLCTDCTLVSYNSGKLIFDVTGFSVYTTEEAPITPSDDDSSSSHRSHHGSSSKEKIYNNDSVSPTKNRDSYLGENISLNEENPIKLTGASIGENILENILWVTIPIFLIGISMILFFIRKFNKIKR